MEDFKIVCMNGIEYNNLETFLDDLESNNDDLTSENCEYLSKYIWDKIEETKGDIPYYCFNIIHDLEIFYECEVDRTVVDCDYYKGWSTELVVVKNPYTKNYYGYYYTQSRCESRYDEELFRVEPYDKIVKSWRRIDDVIDDKDMDLEILKGYLKQAVKDLNRSSVGVSFCERSCHNCIHDINNDCTHDCHYKWKYTDIVEKILGERIE